MRLVSLVSPPLTARRFVPLAALLTLGAAGALAPVASAQTAPAPGACTLGTAQNDLDVNNVAARVFNTGSLFYGNATVDGSGYRVPQDEPGKWAVFASGLWVGGKVNGELRVAGGTYGFPALDYTFWPGPLGDDARPVNPASCAQYDRIYSVSRADLAAYEAGLPAPDVLDWPAALGAPVIDGDGVAGNYNLAGGDRPDIVGDEGVWWLMNDVGNIHPTQNTRPLGIEVRVLAYAFARTDALGDATFYRYTLTNRTDDDITDAYVSFFADVDLGDATDDFVGSDSTLGMGYVYNGDEEDAAYGIPPALGYDIVRGPVVPDGPDAGTAPDTLAATAFSYIANSSGFMDDPTNGVQMYNYQQGLWGDGTLMRTFGDGYGETLGEVTTFAFPGDPVTGQPWSEGNTGVGSNSPNDRRFMLHTGPFTLAAGASQEVVLAIVFAQGADNLNSVTALRAASRLAQAAFDGGLTTSAPAPPPVVRDERVALSAPAPNPFSGRSTVTVRAPAGTPLRAVLYDVLGRRVAVLHDGPTATDAVEIAVDGAGLAPGVYRLHVAVPGGEETVQMLRR